MKQRAHAWTALRALKLIEDSGKAPRLAELLMYYVSDIWDGAWLPDTLIRDMAYGHIFKMDSDPKIIEIEPKSRFLAPYKELKPRLRGKRLCLEYVKDSEELEKPYKAPEFAGDLPSRALALGHMAGDMLKMSDFPMAFYVRKQKAKAYTKDLTEQKIKDLSLSPNFSAREIALTFFILSHYIVDAHMPLHCDLRDYKIKGMARRLPTKLHTSIEAKWESYLPEKQDITLHDYLTKSIDEVVRLPEGSPLAEMSSNKKYLPSTKISNIKGDERHEAIDITRVSYTVSRKWITKPYKNVNEFISSVGEEEFNNVTNRIFHDAVESIARIWYKVWKRYTT